MKSLFLDWFVDDLFFWDESIWKKENTTNRLRKKLNNVAQIMTYIHT